jgi:hypothetical protein
MNLHDNSKMILHTVNLPHLYKIINEDHDSN